SFRIQSSSRLKHFYYFHCLLDRVQFKTTDEFAEGGILYRLHRERERNSKLVSEVKETALAKGNLICEVCGMDFYQTYGELGKGYIECHHKIPLATYEPNQKTSKKDLALVCANCHRMLYRHLATLTVDALQQIVQNRY
ncbi:MAG: HNH endonuclease, partial [Solibacillus sp.]